MKRGNAGEAPALLEVVVRDAQRRSSLNGRAVHALSLRSYLWSERGGWVPLYNHGTISGLKEGSRVSLYNDVGGGVPRSVSDLLRRFKSDSAGVIGRTGS
jgi:hypothetical protein